MTKRVLVKNHQQGNGNLNGSVTAELRQQVVLLKRDLNACESSLSDHLYIMNEVQEALTIARDAFNACRRAILSQLGKS